MESIGMPMKANENESEMCNSECRGIASTECQTQ